MVLKKDQPPGNNGLSPDVTTHNFNGHAETAQSSGNDHRLHSKSIPNIPLGFYRELFTMARQRAIELGALEVTEEDLRSLIELGLAMAKDAYRELFDPGVHHADQLRQQAFDQLNKERKEADVRVRTAFGSVLELEKQQAQVKPTEKPIQPSLSQLSVTVMVISLTVAATLHDRIFTFTDEITAWVISFAFGIFLGWSVVSLTLYHPQTSTTQSGRFNNWQGLIAGIGIGIGLLILRLGQSLSFASIAIALCFTFVEIAAAALFHRVAHHYHQALQEWQTKNQPYLQLGEQCEVARKHHDIFRQQLQAIDQAIDDHRAYVEERQFRHQQIEEIKELVVKNITDGFNDGVAFNLGRSRGVNHGGVK